jgi:Ca2+-binding RTX toxin-like protein
MSRRKISGVYQDLSADPTDYSAAFNRLRDTLVSQGIFNRTSIDRALQGIPRTYEGFRFAMVASQEHSPAFQNITASFGVEEDSQHRAVIGFGYDLAANRGHVAVDLIASGALVRGQHDRMIGAIETYDRGGSAGTPAAVAAGMQLRTALNAMGISISYDEAHKLFDIVAPTYEARLDRTVSGLPRSVERVAMVDAFYQGAFTANDFVEPVQRGAIIAAVNAGDFEEAYVLLTFSDDLGAATSNRATLRGVIFGMQQTDDAGPLSLASAMSLADAFVKHRDDISAKMGSASLNSSSFVRQQLANVVTRINAATERNGIHFVGGTAETLASIAQNQGVNLAYLQTLYGTTSPLPFSRVLLPRSAPQLVSGAVTLDSTQPGQARVLAPIGTQLYNFRIASTDRPAAGGQPYTTLLDTSGRTVGTYDFAGPITASLVNGAVRLVFANGNTLSYRTLPDDNQHFGRRVSLTYVHDGQTETSEDYDRFEVRANGSVRFGSVRAPQQFTGGDFDTIRGFDALRWLPQFGGSREYASTSPVPLPSLDGKIDPDGEVVYETTYNADGSTLDLVSFYLDNGGEGIGDKINATVTYAAGARYASAITVVRQGTDATVTSVRTNPSGSGAIDFKDVEPRITIDYPNRVITAEAVGAILGSTIGNSLGSSAIAKIGIGAVLSTVTGNLGEIIDNFAFDPFDVGGATQFTASEKINEALQNLPQDLLQNLVGAGAGALSSMLTAQLFDALGVGGTVGAAGSSVANAYISRMIENIAFSRNVFDGLGAINPLNIVGSMLGSRLASSIVSFDSIGGQLGSSIGSSIGGLIGGKLLGAQLAQLGIFGGPLGVAIGAFAGFLIGGLIGSLFGGTPEAMAELRFNLAGDFEVGTVSSKKGGSKDAAMRLATSVGDALNGIVDATGSHVLDGLFTQRRFGMRGKDLVYAQGGTTQLKTRDAATLVARGVFDYGRELVGRLAGGDYHIKRAIAATLDQSAAGGFSVETLLGNIAIARDYARYMEQRDEINRLIAAEPDSAFAAGWMVTFARAQELHLNQRNQTDWNGGWAVLLDELVDGQVDGASVSVTSVLTGFNYQSRSRTVVVMNADGDIVGRLADTVESSSKTLVEGTGGNDVIVVNGSVLATTGLTIDGQLSGAGTTTIRIAAVIDGGSGDDMIRGGILGNDLLGGQGNDRLVGGLLDDWIFGDDGDDILFAGDVVSAGVVTDANLGQAGSALVVDAGRATAVDGGNGNLLDGGEGNDRVYGGSGSDWLTGGGGTDQLYGGSGDDVLAGGGGEGDQLLGGGGADQYIVRRGDGSDRVDDVGAVVSTGATDAIVARMTAIEKWKTARALGQTPGSDALRPDWVGVSVGVTSRAIDGGEDAIVFGEGIDLGDVKLQRSGNDLLAIVMDSSGGTDIDSGTRVTLTSWFSDPFKRVEWLKFADGNAIKIGDITSFIIGGAGNDILVGTNGDDFVYGGAGNDAIRALSGNDVALGGTGDDLVSGDADNDVVVGGLGDDQVLGGAGNDSASGDEGADEVYGGGGNDIVSGGKGDGDWVVGGAGDDRFKYSRGDGRDTLFDDYVASGWTNVWVNGTYQAGYVVDAGGNVVASDGTVVAANHGTVAQPDLEWVGRFDYDAQTSTLRRFAAPTGGSMVADAGNDTLEFAPGIDIQDIILRRAGNDLTLVVAKDDEDAVDSTLVADSVTIKDWYVAGLTGQIEKIGFYQTGVLDIQDANNVVKRTLLGGTDGNDAAIAGTGGDDWVTGGAGDDVIAAGIGNDILAGNTGADTLRGEAGDDVLYGGTGNDILDGGAGKDFLVGGMGFDIASYASSTAAVRVYMTLSSAGTGDAVGDEFSGIEGLTGGSGADTLGGDAGENELAGALGVDLLIGSAGDDTYVWRIGDGYDTVYDAVFAVTGTTPTYDTTVDAGANDVLELGAGLSLSDLLFVWGTGTTVNDLYVRHAGSTINQIRIQGQRLVNSRIEMLQLADGLNVSLGSVLVAASAAQLVGTSGDDLLVGMAGTAADTLTGGEGNDALSGYAGDDVLSGGNGDDMLEGGAGADRLDGGTSSLIGSTTTAGDTARYVTSTAGVTVDLTVAGAQLGGDAAGDILTGVENLVGSAFVDALTGDAGGNRLAGLDGSDTLRGGGGDDVLIGDGGNDNLYGDDGADALSGGVGADTLRGGAGDDRLDGGDDGDQLYGEAGNDVLSGGGTGDFLDGGDGDDTLIGDGGSDTLFGGAGDDVLTGGAGDDTLRGDAGNDRYLFGAASGTDTIVDADGVNTIGFDDTVAREQIWLTRSGSDLRIGLIGGATTLTVTGFFTAQSRVRAVQTATHAYYLDNADSLQLVTAMTAVGVATPAAMPAAIQSLLATYWHAGGKAAPTVAAAVRTVATNEDVAAVVSGAFGVVDHDGGALTYRLDPQYQPAMGAISGFDGATGAFVYTPFANRSGDDNVQVIATDADGQSVSIRVALSVAAVNDAPGPISVVGGTLAIAESSTNSTTTTGSIVGQFASVDPDGDAVSYALVDDAGGRFQVTSGGQVTVKTPGLLNYEAASSHGIVVRAVDNLGGATQAAFTIAIGNVNEFNALPAAAAFGINENVAIGTTVGTMTATDPDAATAAFGQQRYYFMTGASVSATSSDGRYVINATTGAITTKVAIDYEAGNVSAVYKVVARDNAGAAPFNETSSQVTIAIANLNEQNALPASVAFAIAENVALGTAVGSVTATDKDGTSHVFGQQRYYFLNGTTAALTSADGRYAINATTGAITTAAALSYEGAAPSATYTVIARDNAGAAGYTQAQTSVTIGITDLNEANALPATYTAMTVAERVAIGTTVGTIQATDMDGSATQFGTQRYAFLSGTTASTTSADGRYVIDAVTGAVKTAAAVDYEAASPTTVYAVIARDNAGGAPYNQAQTSVTIGITDVNESNAMPAAYSWTIAENGAVGANIGRVAATDPDGAATAFGQQRYYFLNGTTTSATSSDGRYTIDATSGTIVATASLNFEAGNPSATYTVVARDNAGAAGYNQAQASVTIGIVDLNEANSLPTTAVMAIAENSAVGTLVGTIVAADLDASTTAFGQQRYYFLNGTTASATSSDGRYTIDALTGTVKTALALNFEAASPSVAYTVIARDNAGIAPYNQAASTVTIGITDVNEAPTAMSWSPAAISVVERDRVAPGTTLDTIVLASFSIADPDTAGSTFATYSYSVNDTRFEFVGNSLRLKQGAVLDYEAGATVSLSVTGTDASATPNTIVRTVSVQVVNADDVLQGGTGNDTLTGQQNRDLISGMAGNDVIDGGAGDDLLDGGTGNDRLLGGLGVDTLYGREDADTLLGGDGNDTLYGGTNAVGTVDTLYGDIGDDVLYGEDGDDVLVGGAGADRLDGGLGSDWADYSLQGDGVAAVAAVTADLTASANNVGLAAGDVYVTIENLRGTGYADTLRGDVGDNILDGGAGNDTLIGEAGNDDIRGGAGADTLNGGDGNDLLSGGDGDDTIRGGAGSDTLLGGAGNDFLYADSGNDMLDGGSGDDFLQGGADNDTYVVTRTSGADTIDNYDAVGTDVDVLGLQDAAGAIEDKDLWIERSGYDMLVSVVGTTSSARIKNWYVTPGVNGANYKIDFIVAGVRQSRTINIEALAVLMATKTKPATVAQRDALLADATYRAKWATYWGTNAKPVIATIANQTINEDTPLVLSIAVSDDITPGAGIAIAGEIVSGGTVIPVANMTWGNPDANGARTLTLTPTANISGTATVRLRATDAGGVVSDPRDFTVTVNPVADTPIIGGFSAGSGTSGGVGIALTVNVTFPDTDGSEVQEIWITGVPPGVTLSAGTYDSASTTWKLTQAQTAGLKVNAPAGWSHDLTLTLTARATEGGATRTASATTTMVLNAPPTSLSLAGTVAENAANGTIVGSVTGIDPDGDALSFTLLDAAGGRFALTAAGVLSVANGALLNYEAAAAHTISVRATDRFGAIRDQVLSVAVTNVNEAPATPTGPARAFFDETGFGANPANTGVVVATYALSDPDGSAPQLQFTANPGNWFTIVGNTVRFAVGFDFEAFRAAGYGIADYNGDGRTDAYVADVGVRTTDGVLTSAATNLSVYITDVNEAPVITAGGGMQVMDETGLGGRPANADAIVATFTMVDPDGTAPTLQLVSNPGNAFYLSGNTLRLAAGVSFDFEALRAAGYAIADRNADGRLDAYFGDVRVRATDNALNSAETVVQFVVSDVNERPNNLVLEASNVFVETTGSDSHSGLLQARFGLTDPDGPAPSLVILSGNDTGWFKVSGQHIQISDGVNWTADWMRSNPGWGGSDTTFAYDTNGNGMLERRIATLTLAARDANGLQSNPFTYSIYIENKNEAPAAPVGGGWKFFDETGLGGNPANGGVTVAAFGMSDPDGTAPTLQLVTNPNGWFYIDGNTVKFSGGKTLDFESLRAAGYGINDWNGDGRLDAHIADVYVRATDGALNSTDTLTQVFVSDVNEAPAAPAGGGWQFLDETGFGVRPANGGQIVATFGMADPDGTAPGLQLVNNPGNWFYIDGNTLRLNSLNFNYEDFRNAGYGINDWNGDGRLDAHIADVYVRATDGALNSPDTLTQVFISDVNERPNALVLEANNVFVETGDGGNHAGLLQTRFGLSDPDGATPQLVIKGGNDNGWFQVNGTHIQVTGANWTADWLRATLGQYGQDAAFSYDTNGNGIPEIRIATLTVAARDAAGAESDPFSYNIMIENRNEQNALAGAFGFGVAENAGVGTGVGTVTAGDPDGGTVAFGQQRYYFWDGANISTFSGDGRFAIDAASGVIRTNAGLDYEATPSVRYTVTARDNYGNPGYTQAFTTVDIGLGNVNDSPTYFYQVPDNPVISENMGPQGTYITTVRAADSDNLGLSYWLDANTTYGGMFSVTSDGRILIGAAGIDYENGTLAVGGGTGRYADLIIYAGDGGAAAATTVRINITDISLPVWTPTGNGGEQLNPAFAPEWRSTPGDRYLEVVDQANGTNDDATTSLPINPQQWHNEYVLRHTASGRAIAYYSEFNRYQNSFSRRPETSAHYAAGYVVSGAWGNFSVYSPDETNTNEVYGGEWPIGLDLNGEGLDIVDAFDRDIFFDQDGDGLRDRTSWVGADDALLALDRDGNGSIDTGAEISFIGDLPGAKSDLEGLAAFDSNADGVLDVRDARFGEFLVWQDKDQDGVSRSDELRTLTEAGIVSLSLKGVATGATYTNGDNAVLATAAYTTAAGEQRELSDLVLGYLRAGVALGAPFTLSEIDALAAPIILDLDQDGKTMVALADSATMFDMVGDGQLRKTAWADAGDAFLVRDRNGNGLVDGIADISFVGDKAGAKTDLEGLAGFDTNADGVLNARDDSFVGFGAWIDADGNGRTDAGELLSLAQAGISSIALTGKATGQTAAQRVGGQSVIFNTAAITMADGTTRSLSDVGLAYDATALGLASAATASVTVAVQDYDRKAKKFLIAAVDGRMIVRLRKANGTFDPAADQVGSATLLTFRNKTVGMLAPIILDLDGDGIEAQTAKKSKARFDMDGNGTRDDTGWVGKDDGILVVDRDGDGRITTNAELSFLTEKANAGSNFEGLAVLDANKDGLISAADARFGELKVWVDRNRDGITDAGELQTLTDLGITQIGVRASAAKTDVYAVGSNLMLATATFTRADGRIRSLGEVGLAFSPEAPRPAAGGTPAAKALERAWLQPDSPVDIDAVSSPEPVGGASTAPRDTVERVDWSNLDHLFSSDCVVDTAPPAPEMPDAQVLQMVQAMSGFGATSAAALDRLSKPDLAGYDYFASAA